MSTENNILIDGNGNDVEVDFDSGGGHSATESECSTDTNSKSGILAHFWKRVWPPKDTRVEYELREQRNNGTAGNTSNRNSASSTTSSGFWSSLLTSFTKSEDDDYYVGAGSMSVSSGESSPPAERMPLTGEKKREKDLDSLYDEGNNVPKTMTNRKMYSEKPTPLPKVRTRREAILSNNRRYDRRSYGQSESWNGNANESRGESFGSEIPLMKDGEGNDDSLMESHKRISLQSLAASENPDSINSNEFTHQCWDIRNCCVAKENFYNVNEMDMYKLFKSGRQSDVTVRCRGKDFKVHTFVLKAQSAQFRRILFMKSEGDPIVVNDILPEDMEALLLYMYTGKVNNKYCDRHGGITSRFEFLLQDYEVPLPEDSTVMIPIITTDFIY